MTSIGYCFRSGTSASRGINIFNCLVTVCHIVYRKVIPIQTLTNNKSIISLFLKYLFIAITLANTWVLLIKICINLIGKLLYLFLSKINLLPQLSFGSSFSKMIFLLFFALLTPVLPLDHKRVTIPQGDLS